MRGARSLVIVVALAVLANSIAMPAVAATRPGGRQDRPPQADVGAGTTPDLAVRAYIQALAAGDLDALLATSAIDDMAAGYRFGAMTKRIGALTTTMLAPSDYPFFAAVNREFLASRLLNQTVHLVYSVLSDQPTGEGGPIRMDDAQVERFQADVDPSRLSSLAVIDSRFPDPKFEHEPAAVEMAQSTAAMYGADEWTERLALVSWDDALYEVGFSLLRYGDEWKVNGQSSVYGGMSSLGVARPTTRELYERHVSGDYSDL